MEGRDSGRAAATSPDLRKRRWPRPSATCGPVLSCAVAVAVPGGPCPDLHAQGAGTCQPAAPHHGATRRVGFTWWARRTRPLAGRRDGRFSERSYVGGRNHLGISASRQMWP